MAASCHFRDKVTGDFHYPGASSPQDDSPISTHPLLLPAVG